MAREPWEFFADIESIGSGARNPWEFFTRDPRHESATGRVETAPERVEREGLERQYQEMGPMRRARAGISNMLSGIPVIRNIPGISGLSTPEDIDISRRARPGLSFAERMTAGTAAYAPVSRAAQLGGVTLRNALTRNTNPNLGLLGELTTQGTLGAGVALADRPPRNSQEAVISALLGFGSGAAGPLSSRLLGPSGTGNRLSYDRRTGTVNDIPELRHLVQTLGASRVRRIVQDAQMATQIDPAINFPRELIRRLNEARGALLSERTGGFITRVAPAAVGAAVGHGMGGVPGAIYGAAMGEVGRGLVRGVTRTRTGQRYLGRTVSPNMASLLHSVGPTYFMNYEDNPTNSATGG